MWLCIHIQGRLILVRWDEWGSKPKAGMQLLKNQLSVFTLKAGSTRPTKQPLSYLLSPEWLTLAPGFHRVSVPPINY